jgi:uncharacterized protein YxjI
VTELTKDFIILIATLIVVLTILSVIFSEKGVLSSVFAFKTYAEPLTLLDHLSATITTASSCPGECSISFKTSGMPYIIEIYKEDGKYYASIDFKLVEQKTNVKFEGIEPKPLISDCVILEQELFLIEGIIQDITVKKTIEDGSCKIFIESIKGEYDFNVTVFPNSGLVLNGSSLTVTVTVSLVGGKIAPGPVRLSTSGEPPGVSIIFSENNLDPTFTSKMIIYADQTAHAGTYQVIIIGTSGSLARWTTFELEVSPLHYTFVLDSKIDIINLPLTGVKVNVNGDIRYTRKHDEFTSNIVYGLSKGIYDVSVEDPFDLRPFSHFRDYDCDGLGNISDIAANPHSFNITNKNRDMTAYYKVFTQIRNLEFDNTTFIISGNLLDEDFNPILKEKTKYETCGGPPTTVYPNRDVKIEYLDACTNSWVPIGSITSSFTDKYRFYDNFNDGDYKGWIVTGGAWSVANGELNSSGTGDEAIQTSWSYWNGSSNGNNNLEVSVKLISGNDVLIKVFDAFNEYYLQTNDTYNNLYLWVNGALKESVALTGINPNEWNTWRIKQNESYIEFYINDKKLIRHDGVPLMGNGRIQLRTLNTEAHFDNITTYDGSWSYYFGVACNVRKIRAVYMPSDWYYNYTSAEIDIDPMMFPCKLTVNTQTDIGETPLSGVEVNVSDGVINRKITKNTTGPSAIAEFLLSATFLHIHNITVNNLFDSRSFSHFWDHDCNTMNVGYWLDTDGNPYNFNICRDKNITVQYKAFTKITDFNFDFSVSPTISGKLLDEDDNPIIKQGHTQPTCTPPDGKIISVNRNVTLEYYKCYKGSCDWHYIGAINSSLIDGSWSYDWGCACNATKLRVNYTPTNWYYMPNSTEISIICPCKLTVITQIDIGETPLSGVEVNVNGKIKYTDSFGIVTYDLFPGTYDVSVVSPFGLRPFSHFWDNDCHPTNLGYWLDTESNPYTFGMHDRDKTITAQYKAFTYITDSRNITNTFEYNGTLIKGRLLDERNESIINHDGQSRPKCINSALPYTPVPVNRNVTLEVYNSTDSKWYYINATDSLADGNWSYNWVWVPGVTKIRANYTPLAENWYYVGTSVEIPIYTLTVFTVLDIEGPNNPPVPNINVILDGVTKLSDYSGKAQFLITPKSHNINVESFTTSAYCFGPGSCPSQSNSVACSALPGCTWWSEPRNFSHFWDHDCNGLGNSFDSSSNPLTFTAWNKDRNITAFYKTFTFIKDTLGNKNNFEYVSNVIKGKLQDERNNYIGTSANKAPVCGNPSVSGLMYRNVTLEYFNGIWNKLTSVEPDTTDGSWSYDWVCACNTTKIRASYKHTDWYYNSTSTEINIDPSLCPCKLTVFAQVDAFTSPLSNVQVVVDGTPKFTDVSGKTEFMIKPGSHTITVDKLSNRFSHFWDQDCNKNNIGYWLDNESNPYTFGMYDREKNITAQYKAFTKITDSIGTANTFDYDGSSIKGKLLDERNGAILLGLGHKQPVCDKPDGERVPINRNVTLEYYSSSDSSWYYIGVVDSLADGSWSLNWNWVSGTTKLRTNYTPTNWYYEGTSVEISLYRLIVFTVLDIASSSPVPNVQVTVDGVTRSSGAAGKAEFMLTSGVHNILVDSKIIADNNRPFSHYWDHNCSETHYYDGWYLDTGQNPYIFTAYVGKDREIIAFYKAFTNITNSAGSLGFDYDGFTIKGKLLKQNGDAIGSQYHRCDGCTNTSLCVVGYWDRNVSLEYYKCYKGVCNWYSLDSVKSDAAPGDGSWSRNWICECNTTKIRAKFIPNANPKDWYYNYSDAEINIDPSMCPCKSTVFTVLDISGNPAVPNVNVNVDGTTKPSGASGKAEFFMKPGPHNILVEDPKGPRPFSHFWDHDCNSLGDSFDTNSSPYTFTTWNKDRNITAFYKTFTYIKDSLENPNTFDYDGATISGKLQDEVGNYIVTSGCKTPVCGVPGTCNPMYRNVTLEYFDGSWHKIDDSIEPDTSDGSWSYDWSCIIGATKLRANYTPSNWYYMGTNAEIPIICIIPNQPPIASFTESATKVKVGNTINFDASGSSDPDGVIVSYNWNFGDGKNGVGAIVNHAYSNRGTYTVTLTVTDDDGATNTTSATKTVIRCSGEISVSNDATTCGSTTFTDTITNTGSALTIEMADELWTDPECDNMRNNYVTGYYESDISISAGQTITRSWSTPLANNPGICYIHSIWFCSKPLDASNPCWNYSDICYAEADVGNIKAKWNEKEFKCGVPPQCSDGIDNTDPEDVLIDANDPGCHSDGNTANPASYDPNDNDETDYLLKFVAQVDAIGLLLSGVEVNVNGMIKYTDSSGIATYKLPPGTHTISVKPKDSRDFSHYWDHNCSEAHYYEDWYNDTSDNPFTFTAYVGKDREITAQYKTFTNITDSAGTPNTFDYDGSTISGKLLKENGDATSSSYHRCDGCNNTSECVVGYWNRNITLEYSTNGGATWIYIDNVTISSADASWSKTWSCVPGTNKLRARYIPSADPKDWYYNFTSAEISISCPSACGAYSWQFPSSSVASSEYSSSYTASKCIDSNTGTDWYSLEAAPPAVYHWIQFNLGSKKCISGTRVEIPAIDTPLTIKVDVSNDTVTWTNIISDWSITTDTETWVENYFAETNGHYIRLNYTQLSRPNPYGTCREFQAYTANSH